MSHIATSSRLPATCTSSIASYVLVVAQDTILYGYLYDYHGTSWYRFSPGLPKGHLLPRAVPKCMPALKCRIACGSTPWHTSKCTAATAVALMAHAAVPRCARPLMRDAGESTCGNARNFSLWYSACRMAAVNTGLGGTGKKGRGGGNEGAWRPGAQSEDRKKAGRQGSKPRRQQEREASVKI